MLLLGLLAARYPTSTASWATPDVASQWPTDTEPWGPPPTEFFTDTPEKLSASALVGISVAALAAAAFIFLSIFFFIKGRSRARPDKKFDSDTPPTFADTTKSPLL